MKLGRYIDKMYLCIYDIYIYIIYMTYIIRI